MVFDNDIIGIDDDDDGGGGVSDDCLIRFFENASNALENLDMKQKQITTMKKMSSNDDSSNDDNMLLSLVDCRKCILEVQKSALLLLQQQQQSNKNISIEQIQKRLSNLRRERNLSIKVESSMKKLDEIARLALCKLVLYNQHHYCHHHHRDSSVGQQLLQSTGKIEDRSKLVEFIALNRTALKLPIVKDYLKNGPPLFNKEKKKEENDNDNDNDNDENVEEESCQKFLSSKTKEEEEEELPTAIQISPQNRLEYIQCLLSKAVGWDPDFTTRELKRIFFFDDASSKKNNEYSNDQEVMDSFQKLMMESNEIIRDVQQHQQQQLSDIDQGGVTRVVSVQYSEFEVPTLSSFSPSQEEVTGREGGGSSSTSSSLNNAPKLVSINNDTITEEERKRQIRLASDAATMQNELLHELISMPESERNTELQKAKIASDGFTKHVLEIPPGPDRIALLQSIDPDTSRLLLIYKLWNNHIASKQAK